MNMLNINFDKYMDDIKDAFTEVLGPYYEDIISERIDRTQVIHYTNFSAMQSYYDELCKAKMRELALKFFNKFGIDTSSYAGKKVSERFPEELSDIVSILIGSEPFSENDFKGIKSFLEGANPDDKKIISRRVRVLNFMRGSDDLLIADYENFIQTDEYRELEVRIREYLSYYYALKKEYEEYLPTIKSYKDYIDKESERKKDLLRECKKKFLLDIEFYVPDYVKNYIEAYRRTWDPLEAMFENESLYDEFYIEYFSEKEEAELNSNTVSGAVKEAIKRMRLVYFKNLGVDCDPFDPNEYDRIMQSATIRMLVPSQKLIKAVKKYREIRYEEAQLLFYTECDEFIHQFDKIPFSKNVIVPLYSRIKDNTVCVTEGSDDLGFLRVLFFAIKPFTLGKIDFMFLHELVHAIESDLIDGIHACGFEGLELNAERSEVNSKYRKYERFNETVADMLAIEVREKLIEKGIYIAEDEKVWIRDVYNFNSHSILKKMVKPLMDNYRDIVIHARISGDMDAIYYVIGKDNFEELNYLVSHVDYLISEGLVAKLDHNLDDDPLVIEYKEDMEKLEKVYERIRQLNEVPGL